ncbi:hypothetical protein ABMA28_010563 [Loxostege sticticalis]|uniref:Uncharacterized protein n=1 Tax=Loxostege sticticalis TaxID=481309 RepID=A0ABD0S8M4_LOXSC
MSFFILLSLNCFIYFTQGHVIPSEYKLRSKREVAGALHIVTKNTQAIHEDVKPENAVGEPKPCPEKDVPSAIEMGTVFQVTPPQDEIFEGKSLRKSAPLISRFEIARSINRVVTLAVLIFTAVIEFYPMLRYLFSVITFLFL